MNWLSHVLFLLIKNRKFSGTKAHGTTQFYSLLRQKKSKQFFFSPEKPESGIRARTSWQKMGF